MIVTLTKGIVFMIPARTGQRLISVPRSQLGG